MTIQALTEAERRLVDLEESYLLIPKLFLQKKWSLKRSSKSVSASATISPTKTNIFHLYVARPKPLFRLKLLHKACKNFLIECGISPNDTVVVGGHNKRPILSLIKFRINPSVLALPKNKNIWVWAERLTFRGLEGVTLCFWTRAAAIYAHANRTINDPVGLISDFLKNTLDYPKFIIKAAIKDGNGAVERLLREFETIKWNNIRGWRIIL